MRPVRRSYVAFRSNNRRGYRLEYTTSDMYHDEHVKSYYDHMLHETLSTIFLERRLTSGQIKELLRKHDTNRNSIFELILQQKPVLSEILPRKPQLSLLWIAVLGSYRNSAELLVWLGADVKERCKRQSTHFAHNKWTILHVLLRMYPSSWNERFIALVTNRGADMKASECNGKTVLHYAVSEGRVQATKLFLEKGANVNVRDNDFEPPLLAAARSRKADELLPLLINHGANVFAKECRSRENALHLLARNLAVGHVTDLAARVLMERGVSLDDREHFHRYQPIHLAAKFGNNVLVKCFLDHGANVNARAADGEFPLFLAAGCNNAAVLLTLLKGGANIDLKTIKDSHTALHIACRTEKKENIKILLSIGADVFIEDRLGLTPINYLPMPSDKWIILKTLALKEGYHQRLSTCNNYQEDCVEQVDRMKITKIIETCTFFDLLTKCQCQIADLFRNRQFENKFKLYDLNVFPIYAKDMLEAFERAEHLYRSRLEQEEVINEAVCNTLPHMIVRKVARYILHCDICEMKKIVHASRDSIDNSH